MPKTAETNYLSDVNAAMRQRSTARRRRIDSILDPLEEAARMDRMQNASVSGDLGEVQDPGYGGPTLATVGGGRSMPISNRGPIRQMLGGMDFGGGSGDGGCPGGQCGVPTTTTVGMPMGGTVVGGDGGVIMGEPVPPAMPAIAPQRKGESDAAYAARQAAAYADHYIGVPAPFSRSSVLGANEAMSRRNFAQSLYDADFRNRQADETVRVNTAEMDLAKDESARQDKTTNAEVGLTNEQAQLTKEQTGLGRAATYEQLMDDVTSYRIGPEAAVSGLIALHKQTLPMDEKRKIPGKGSDEAATGTPPLEIEQKARREVYGRLGMKTFLDLSQSLRAAMQAGDEGQFDIANDADAKRALSQIASGYHSAGLFDPKTSSWGAVDAALTNDVSAVLRQEVPVMFAKAAEQYVAGEKMDKAAAAAYVDAARRRGLEAAVKTEDYMRETMKLWYMQNQSGLWQPEDPFTPKQQPTAPRPGDYPALNNYMRQRGSAKPTDSGAAIPVFREGPEIDANNTLPPVPNRFARSV